MMIQKGYTTSFMFDEDLAVSGHLLIKKVPNFFSLSHVYT